MDHTEAVLVFPARLTQAMHNALRTAHCIPRHWHLGGRHGSRIAVPSGQPAHRSIPILRAAESKIVAVLQCNAQPCSSSELPDALLRLLRGGDVQLQYRRIAPAAQASLAGHIQVPTNSQSLLKSSVLRSAPMSQPFTYAELFAGIGGFGLGFGVLLNPGDVGEVGSAGEYNWGGAAGTRFWIDPQENLIGIFMVQSIPHRTRLAGDFKALTYSAMTQSQMDDK